MTGVLANHEESETPARLETSVRAFFDEGRFAEARSVAERLTTRYPSHGRGWMALGIACAHAGDAAGAVAPLQRAAALLPEVADAHFRLCIVLRDLSRLTEAEESCRKTLALKPDFTDGHGVLGSILLSLGRHGEAESSFRDALRLSPDLAMAHCNLGISLQALGRPAEAGAAFLRALAIDPRYVLAHQRLGDVLLAQGRAAEALSHSLHSLRIKETDGARRHFAACVSRLSFAKEDGEVRALVLRALTEPWVRPGELATVANNFVKLNPVVRGCLAPHSPFGSEVVSALAGDVLLCGLLNAMPVCDVELERFLTRARRALLEEAAAAPGAAGGSGPALAFYGALANQCFMNEYVFACPEDESLRSGALRDALRAALEAGEPVPPLLVLAVAAYFPLGSLPLAPRLLLAQWPDAVAAVLVRQVREPEEELRLRPGIARLTDIDDETSLRVRNQYEENPYPRWTRAGPVGRAVLLAAFLRQRFPQSFLDHAGVIEDAGRDGIDILVAGCGTGQHSIETSQMYVGARVLAVDLSLTSLAYARRKTEELGLACIEYAQADLLRLESLERRFDLIESGGVLHHLADPWAGWRVLVSLLQPGGVMRLGFYSELARRHFSRLRAFIAEQGYGSTAGEIRRFRQDLLRRDPAPELRSVTSQSDFFSTSACRDLLFHVQEHRMSLTDIDAFIRANGLVFLGFDIDDEVRRAYGKRFPLDRPGVNLNQWQHFENDNPDTFIGMYQFWVQKAS
jgi:tetratricopeptide (TPR) repeat protein/2-polyprenyl-3-methyl-5-hydroxy-6-metoxy-1,4-benzoquinol methylase